jgi:ABC-type multidrug transport system fused ATPase/permease subunit
MNRKTNTRRETGVTVLPTIEKLSGQQSRISPIPEPSQSNVLEDISLSLRKDTVTALVGVSGSGKTTLLKLHARILPPHPGGYPGAGDMNIQMMSPDLWRGQCGVGDAGRIHIFSDTIASNIALGEQDINTEPVALCGKNGLHRRFHRSAAPGLQYPHRPGRAHA